MEAGNTTHTTPRPAVGRIVHYVAYGTPGGEFPVGVCRAAVITEVDPPRPAAPDDGPETPSPEPSCVGLCVLNPTGQYFNRHTPYDGSATPAPGTWHWPERV